MVEPGNGSRDCGPAEIRNVLMMDGGFFFFWFCNYDTLKLANYGMLLVIRCNDRNYSKNSAVSGVLHLLLK